MRLVSIFTIAFPHAGAIMLKADATTPSLNAQTQDGEVMPLLTAHGQENLSGEEEFATRENSPRIADEFPYRAPPRERVIVRTQSLRNPSRIACQQGGQREMPYPCTAEGKQMKGGVWDLKETAADLEDADATQASYHSLNKNYSY